MYLKDLEAEFGQSTAGRLCYTVTTLSRRVLSVVSRLTSRVVVVVVVRVLFLSRESSYRGSETGRDDGGPSTRRSTRGATMACETRAVGLRQLGGDDGCVRTGRRRSPLLRRDSAWSGPTTRALSSSATTATILAERCSSRRAPSVRFSVLGLGLGFCGRGSAAHARAKTSRTRTRATCATATRCTTSSTRRAGRFSSTSTTRAR